MAAQTVVLKVLLYAQMTTVLVVYLVVMRRCVRVGYGRDVALSVAVGVPIAAAIGIIVVALLCAL